MADFFCHFYYINDHYLETQCMTNMNDSHVLKLFTQELCLYRSVENAAGNCHPLVMILMQQQSSNTEPILEGKH